MTAPTQRAINAAAVALLNHWDRQDAMSIQECCARVAITAAYPHLYQTLSKENRELRARIAELET